MKQQPNSTTTEQKALIDDTTRKLINKFRDELLIAFFKMIKGINVELSEKGKEEIKDTETCRWWFILAIHEDESLTICSQNHFIIEGATLSWLKLS